MVDVSGLILDIVVAAVAVIGLVLSIISLARRKAKIYLKKVSADFDKDDKKYVNFYFYLGNLGETPATIENIEFYSKQLNNYMPRRKFAIVSEKFLLAKAVTYPLEDISLPFNLNSYESKKLKAVLIFNDEKSAQKILDENNQIHFNVRVSYNGKLVD